MLITLPAGNVGKQTTRTRAPSTPTAPVVSPRLSTTVPVRSSPLNPNATSPQSSPRPVHRRLSSLSGNAPSYRPHTMFNPGVNTRDAAALDRQAANLRAQADANEARAEAIRQGQHVRTWSNDSHTTFEGFGDEEQEEEEEEEE